MSDAEKSANDNPWYCLATVYGEQPATARGEDLDGTLAAKNRMAWNRWIAGVLSEEQRADLVRNGFSEPELAPLTPEEKTAFSTAFAFRTGRENEPPPNPAEVVDFAHTHFDTNVIFDGFLYPRPATFNSATFSRTANFRGARFSEEADFYSATFSGEATFNSATFSRTANFRGARFSEEADFYSATFSQEVDFYSAMFSRTADFSSATFSEEADFYSEFSKKANFRGARFSGTANFGLAKERFPGEGGFRSAAFSGEVDFSGATFSGEANFNSARFPGEVDFSSATFSGEADFISATFRGEADFMEAKFPGAANFSGATFSGEAFLSARFPGEATFRSATFSGEATFRSATFRGEADFMEAKFPGAANFSGATFSGEADFYSATFSGEAVFRNATFTHKTVFADVVFGTRVPDFRGAQLHEATEWHDAAWPGPPHDKDEAQAQVNAYGRLKQEMERLKKHEDEQFFFRKELRARRGLSRRPGEWLLNSLYEISSDYGQSVSFPALWLVALFLVGFFVFVNAPVFNGAPLPILSAAGLSLANIFSFLPAKREIMTKEMIDGLAAPAQFLGGIQSLLGVILLFLVGLALRTRFRMK